MHAFVQLTDFAGTEQAAAVSRDGRFVAFLSDRDGRVDVWVTQVGTGQFYNLTRGSARELVNPSVRTLGFSPDGTSSPSGRAGPRVRVNQTSASGLRRSWADSHDPTWKAPPNTIGRATALVSSTTRPDRVIRCSCAIPASHPKRADLHSAAWASQPLPRLVPGSGVHLFRPGAVPDRMDIWRSGQPEERPSGSRITTRSSATRFS